MIFNLLSRWKRCAVFYDWRTFTTNPPNRDLTKTRRRRQRQGLKTKSLWTKTIALRVFWYISLPSSTKQQRKMTKFKVSKSRVKFVWFCWQIQSFVGLLIRSFSCSVDKSFIILLTAEQSFDLSFTVHVHYFLWSFIFWSRPILLHLRKFDSYLKQSSKRLPTLYRSHIKLWQILLAHISLILALICDNLDREQTQILKIIRYKGRK